MKKHAILLVTIVSLFLSPSCSKKSSNTPACQIITITDQNGTSTTTYNITYNNQGKISTEEYAQSGTNYTRVFTYSGNTEILTTSGGGASTVDSITLNSSGLIESDYFSYTGNLTVTTYTYSGTELQKEVQVANGGTPATTTFTWSNGDVVSSNDGTTTASYTYNTKGSVAGDYWNIIQLVNYGASFVKTAHQLSVFSSGTTVENINYTYDNSNKITGVTATTGANVESITYQYTCN
jgi:hypothetical protein